MHPLKYSTIALTILITPAIGLRNIEIEDEYSCRRNKEQCHWLNCYWAERFLPPNAEVGDIVCLFHKERNYKIINWTKLYWKDQICSIEAYDRPNFPGVDCCNNYGFPCLAGGYQALVCPTDQPVTLEWKKPFWTRTQTAQRGNKCAHWEQRQKARKRPSKPRLQTITIGSGYRRIRPRAMAAMASTSFVRGKATLPDLPYDYGALEPYISGKIMELHHSKHHQTYVNGFNAATEALAQASAKNDAKAATAQAPLLNFHGGGHLNHSLFWENLAPHGKGGGGDPDGKLLTAINEDFGSLDALKKQTNAALAGIQGSGWAWLVKEKASGTLSVVTRANQDPITGNLEPLLGIDAWEHAYYLQYQNRKAEYFDAIWNVVNWGTVAKRFEK
ncbi:hypothetical protein CP533_2783 [Ophiocordyceps camponoti-saundersi (nom. inval.)]|nr:hypothetical protein CP533_2783 [Ophiocordyceps camponoti-saundersi (nom. inval.)]